MRVEDRNVEYYDYLRKNELKYTADFGPSANTRYRIIIKLLKKYSNRKESIIDVGCGTGRLLLLFKKYGFNNLSGSDFSIESINTIRRNLKKNDQNIFQADLTNRHHFSSQIYDVVVCTEVLEHIKDDVTAIENINLLLNKSGKTIISVPYNMKYWSQHDVFAGHFRRYTNDDLEEILKKNGFKIIESFGWGSFLYSAYHKILSKNNPKTVMSKKNLFFKKIISHALTSVFSAEIFFKSKKYAKRLFVVAEKVEQIERKAKQDNF